VSRVLFTITTFWLFVSPVYFPAPETGAMGTIMRLNPVTPLLTGARSLALTGDVAEAARALPTVAVTLVLLLAAWLYARVALPVAIEQTTE
jgi:lipopolysaccharide transport system permease protein